MPRTTWPLLQGKPKIEIILNQVIDGQQTARSLLADTGAGSNQAPFELILDETDCLTCGGSSLDRCIFPAPSWDRFPSIESGFKFLNSDSVSGFESLVCPMFRPISTVSPVSAS